MAGRLLLLALVAALAAASPAQAALVQTDGFQGSTQGIAIGPDGHLWVGEPNNDTIVRMRQDGTVLQRYAVGGDATDIVSGPGGRVWAAVVTGPDGGKLVWFDARAAAPTAHTIDTTPASTCDPVAVAAGNNGRIYVALPDDGPCPESRLAHLADDGGGALTPVSGRGKAYDLEVSGGKLFVPDYEGDVVRRLTLNNGLTVEATITVPGGGNPRGVASDGAADIWTTLSNGGTVARFPASAGNSSATRLTPSGGELTSPFGITAAADGAMYAAGFNSTNVARIDRGTNAFTFFPLGATAYPWWIVPGTDEDLWISDVGGNNRVLHLLLGGPRIGTLNLAPDSPTSAVLDIQVDPRAAATELVVDYGTTAGYGTSTAPVAIPASVGFTSQRVTLSGLSPGTAYHARARVKNADGEEASQDMTFATPPAPAPPVVTEPKPPVVLPPSLLGARIVHRARASRRFTRITKLRVEGLVGGEKIVVTCSGRGCPFRRRTTTAARAGAVNLQRPFRRRKLRRGAIVRVIVTKAGSIGRSRSLTVRRRRSPRVANGCLAVGTTSSTRCP